MAETERLDLLEKVRETRRTGERIYLRELDPTHGRIEDEPAISCSFFCEMAEQDIEGRR